MIHNAEAITYLWGGGYGSKLAERLDADSAIIIMLRMLSTSLTGGVVLRWTPISSARTGVPPDAS